VALRKSGAGNYQPAAKTPQPPCLIVKRCSSRRGTYGNECVHGLLIITERAISAEFTSRRRPD
jgi:hypothetical protein